MCTKKLKNSAADVVKRRFYEDDIRLTSLCCYPKIHGFQDLVSHNLHLCKFHLAASRGVQILCSTRSGLSVPAVVMRP